MEAPQAGMIQLATVLRFVDIATDALGGAREEIDALNVYPVPDGDTGTNMYLTVSAARDAIREAVGDDPKGADAGKALAAFSRGALLGARGNCGVILSQMLGAIAHRIAEQQPGDRNAAVMAEALQQATDASYAAVGEPVEGTILTVARAASDAAMAHAADPAEPRPRRAHPGREGRPRGARPYAGAAQGPARRRRRRRRWPRAQRHPRRRRDGAHRPPPARVQTRIGAAPRSRCRSRRTTSRRTDRPTR